MPRGLYLHATAKPERRRQRMGIKHDAVPGLGVHHKRHELEKSASRPRVKRIERLERQ
jgi:hypothetical protein